MQRLHGPSAGNTELACHHPLVLMVCGVFEPPCRSVDPTLWTSGYDPDVQVQPRCTAGQCSLYNQPGCCM